MRRSSTKGCPPFSPQSPKDGRFSNMGFGFLLQSSRQNLDPSDKFFRECQQKIKPYQISFVKGHQPKFEDSFSTHLWGEGV